MAILKAFPPSNTISPSVRITEKDLSYVAPAATFHRAGLVGFASKGPINMPTVVRTQRQLFTTFGYPHPETSDPYLIYAAQQYLLIANELYIVRVADDWNYSDEQASIAEVDIPSAGSAILVQSATAEYYDFSWDTFVRWRLNGVLASKTLVVPEGVYTCASLVTELNDQLDLQIDGIEFFCNDSNQIGLRTTWAYGPEASFEWVSVQDAAYEVMGVGTGMTSPSITGTADRYPVDGYTAEDEFIFDADDTWNLQIVIDGTDNVLVDNTIQTIDLSDLADGAAHTMAEIVNEINGQINDGTIPGGFVAFGGGVITGPDDPSGTPIDLTTYAGYNLPQLSFVTVHAGRDAKLYVRVDSTADTAFGLANVTQTGTSPSGVGGTVASYTYGILSGPANTTNEITFTATADSAGIEGNLTMVRVKNDIREGVFTLDVFSNEVQVESWGYLTKDSTSRFYVETFLALVSDYIRAEDNTDTGANPADGEYELSGGSDGIPADPDDQDALLIGSMTGYTGMYSLSEPEQVDIDLIAIPGHSSTSVIYALLDLCQNMRMDCMAIIDPPFGLTVKEITHWQNGTHPLNTTRFDSDFGALYWPWVKMRDTYNRVDVWVPPSGSVLAVYARSDFLSAPWYAPAGVTRGQVPGITDVFQRPTLEERDLMYGNRNCVNCIVQFADYQDFMVWGQKTLQRRPTALDRVNVRRLMFYIEKMIRSKSRAMLFDPHDEEFHNRFIQMAQGVLNEVQVGRGLYDYMIKADWELNTPDVVDRNEFRARIGVQPTRAVEFMYLEFSIHRTGSFSENTEQPYTY
jgi:phage tail sheath protein FI